MKKAAGEQGDRVRGRLEEKAKVKGKRGEAIEEQGMAIVQDKFLEDITHELHISRDDLIRQSLRVFLEQQLRQINAEILRITGRYGISSAEEMELRYRDGTLEEAESWQELQHLDHLEYKSDRLQQLIRALDDLG